MSALSPALLDTSVIVRYLTDDPPEMAAAAARIIDSNRPLLVSELALVESAYVLASVYDVARADIVDALSAFIQRTNIQLLTVAKPLALDALRLCRGSNRHSFADALQWAETRQRGVDRIVTFDQRLPAVDLRLEVPG